MDSPYAIEGTKAHAVLEQMVREAVAKNTWPLSEANYKSAFQKDAELRRKLPREMLAYCLGAANYILDKWEKAESAADLLIEKKISLPFIHPAMFGTLDYGVIDHFDVLHILDFKYGVRAVAPKNNLQLIYYALGVGHLFDFNFKRVRLTIIQPRAPGYKSPLFWEIDIRDLLAFIPQFREAVKRVERQPDVTVEGTHCHWCIAKSICPLKKKARQEAARAAFSPA